MERKLIIASTVPLVSRITMMMPIGFEHSDLHFCKSMLLLSPLLLVAVTIRCLNGVNKLPRDALLRTKGSYSWLAGVDLTLY